MTVVFPNYEAIKKEILETLSQFGYHEMGDVIAMLSSNHDRDEVKGMVWHLLAHHEIIADVKWRLSLPE
jgi:hypothetical protein